MIRIVLHGCNGTMGDVITRLAEKDEELQIVAGIDVEDQAKYGFPVFTAPDMCDIDADVVIDFSVAKAADALLDFCEKRGLPVVLCTTGLSNYQLEKVNKAAEKVAVLQSANMSLGINLLVKVLKEATKTLAPQGYDIEILEKHHHWKLDAPSGTALVLADSINSAMDKTYHYKYDRHSTFEKRDAMEIGIQAIRGGNLAGEHDVYFIGEDEVITFSHIAYSRSVFGKGALAAAKFLAGKKPGLYSMADVVG